MNTEITKNKKLFIGGIILILLLVSVFTWQRDEIRKIVTSFLGVSDKATLSIYPSTGSYDVDQTFQVDIILDTNNNNVVTTGAYINYDTSLFEVVNIDASQSEFNIGNACKYNGVPCEIISHDSSAGEIEIVKTKPTPGVNGSNILIATLTLKGKKEATPGSDNFTFDFTAPYTGKAQVILDDGQGTNILSGVNNAKYTFSEDNPPNGFNADIDGDGDIDFDDAVDFLVMYRNGDPGADVDGDGDVDFDDAVDFLVIYRNAN